MNMGLSTVIDPKTAHPPGPMQEALKGMAMDALRLHPNVDGQRYMCQNVCNIGLKEAGGPDGWWPKDVVC